MTAIFDLLQFGDATCVGNVGLEHVGSVCLDHLGKGKLGIEPFTCGDGDINFAPYFEQFADVLF